MKKLVLTVVPVLVFCCCSGANLQKQLTRLMGQRVSIPDFTQAVYDGRDTLFSPDMEAMTRMVVFFDSTVCSSCKVSHMWEWDEVVSLAGATKGKFHPVFIFSPAADQQNQLRISLRSYPFEWPVFIDTENLFLDMNPFLPADKRLHTFLLDKDDQIVLVGNPTGNDAIWELHKKTIRSLINNGGKLPEEGSEG